MVGLTYETAAKSFEHDTDMFINNVEYAPVMLFDAYLPTFWVKSGNKYVKKKM